MGDAGSLCKGPLGEGGCCVAELGTSLPRGTLPSSQSSGADGTGSVWILPLMRAETRAAVKQNAGF